MNLKDGAQQLLEHVFGYHSFREPQAEIIEHVAAGGDALVIMPTGGGKSLCYQLPALLREGVAIVVSPLIALMRDQVLALQELGVKAAYLNSSLLPQESARVTSSLLSGELQLLYVAPERLMTADFQELLSQLNVSLFAIDEAHCVSQWGHDFRPEYLQLSVLHERYPDVPRIALTATADELTRVEIAERLELQNAAHFIAGFDRPNIRYQVRLKQKAKEQLLEFLEREHRGESGIIYCLSRNKVEQTAAWLMDEGWNALPYHAGLPPEVRQANQDRFIREDGLVMVATIAFGMGIDKPDVRFVAHLDLPKSIEAYYQETGRAGRDGLPANAWMAYSLADVVALRQMLSQSEATEQRKLVEQRRLNALLGYCETTACRRQVLLKYFGEEQHQPCGNCDCCLEPPETWDGTVAAQQALSAAYRTNQRFGVGYLVDLLRGKENERNVQFGHSRLNVFGVGKELDEKQWHSVFRQLVALGYLSVDVSGYGSLLLTERSGEVLKGLIRVQFRKDQPAAKRMKVKRDGKVITAQVCEAKDRVLFDELRQHRMQLAKAQGVPAYVIFHDATLAEMASKRPQSVLEMRQISGVGDAKLSRYGESFLKVVNTFVDR